MANATFFGSLRASGNPSVAQATVLADVAQAAVEAVDDDIGVLVADAASPTQAHVNDLVATWAVLEPAIAAAAAQATGGVAVTIDLAAVTSVSQLHKIFSEIETAARGSGLAA
jgi:hypothetical protein